ncbi:Lar family restriction alleviation protein [Burkholderia ambifaria]|uniref:Lar family restriction alleviation protein n=1 Tax=Burkholderia ambifaria TaxID=152480 RepID=UPI00158DE450|nr:Lar family restriction alleviation protein [Burkholderia ambifaria]
MTTTDKSRADALTDLLPCPFCGSAASLNSDHIDYFVLCDTCSGEGPRLQSPTGNHEASKRGAIAAWNARAPVEQHEAAPAGDIATLIAYAEGSKSAAVVNACRRVAAWQANAGQHEAAPAEHDVNQLLEAAALGLERAGMLDSMRIVRGMKPGYPKQPAPSAPLEGTGNGADERAAFIAAFLETLPPESVAEFEAAARGIAESAIDARGPSWKMWRAGIAYIRSVLEGGNHA